MRFVNKICSLVFGSVFFIAGLLKLMDPVGAGLVVQEYFALAGLYGLFAVAKPLAVAMAMLEAFVGCAVITGVWRRIVALVSAAMMGFFTLLTLVIYIIDAPMDCGCFGEAIHLTHAQTLIKNLALCALWAGAFLPFSRHGKVPELRYASQAIVCLFVVFFSVWSLLNVPPMDFTPYAPGTEISSDEAEPDRPVLSCSDAEGEYPDSLLTEGKLLVVSLYEPHALKEKYWKDIADLTDLAARYGLQTVILAATTPDDINGAAADPRLLSNLYFADRRELMTFNRSNGGVTLMNDGMIVRKWGARKIPDELSLSYISETDASTILVESNSSPRLKVQAFLLFTFAVMLLL